MPEDNKSLSKFYEFADLSAYNFRQRFLIRAADLIFYALIRLIGATVKFEIDGAENFEKIEQAGKLPIYAFWHNQIFSGAYSFRNRGILVLISQSLDGEYIARCIQRFGFGAIRGSSTRGGVGALVEMIRAMKSGLPTVFTVDGPKGPKYVVKEGVIALAKKTGNPILPICFTAKHFWEVKSWDKLQIPKPFTRVFIESAEPCYVSATADEIELKQRRDELQKILDELVENGKKRFAKES